MRVSISHRELKSGEILQMLGALRREGIRSFLFCLFFLVAVTTVEATDASFEDTRCRCVCPSTKHFGGANASEADDNGRRYYTKSNVNAVDCNPKSVVKDEVVEIVDVTHLDAFLANCDCKYESRNTVMLKVVVIFVICVVMVLVAYMIFLVALDPMLRRKRSSVPYRQQNDEMEDNIFARGAASSDSVESTSGAVGGSPTTSGAPTTMRARNPNSNSVLDRVEHEQNRWMRKVEEQRKKIFTDHTMLN